MRTVEEIPDRSLKPWERLVVSVDPASSDGDDACMVVAIYDSLRGKLIIVDIESHNAL
jgi:phage terminase large subunit-like protein